MADKKFIARNGLAVGNNVSVIETTGVITAGNTTITGFANVSSTLQVGGNVVLSSTTGISANGSVGSAGQGLVSNGSAVYWSNNPGYTGSAGFTGSQGTTGFTGSLGAQGPIGFTGSLGTQGPIGFTGSLGAQGPIGFTGSLGAQGPIGFTGSLGAQGPQGAQGAIGFTGSLGAQGPIGFTGSLGAQGPIGFTGSLGAQGPQGATGPQGPIGFTGSLGAQGPQGATGPQGPIGFTGSLGAQGPIGFTGSLGAQGPQGATGPQGPIGFTGSLGAQGPQGATGPQGPAGPTGPQGPIGFTGSLGAQGPAGPTGPQGPQGAQGAQGATGPQGPIGYTGSSTANFQYLGTNVSYDNDRTVKVNGGIAIYQGFSTGANRPTTYDTALQVITGAAGFEIAADWISTTSTPLFVRSLRDCCQNWSSWTSIATAAVSFTNNVDLRAPIFYDSNDTTYYVDPAGNGTRAGYLNGNLWINPKSEGYGEGVTFYMPNQATWGGLRWYRNGSPYTGNWAFGYFGNESSNDIGFHNGTNGWRLDHSFNNSVTGSFRAPIFYDTDNTAYYMDASTWSSFYGLAIRGDNSASDSGNQIFFWGAGDTTTSAIGFKASAGEFTNPTGNGDGYNTYFTMDTDGRGWVFRRGTGGGDFTSAFTSGWILNNGVWQAQASMRAPIFYDSNDTTYFFDGASTSRLNQARFQNRISVGDGSGTPFLNAGSPGVWLSFNGGTDIFMGSESSTSAGFYLSAWRFTVNSSGTATATGDFRAPLFYDSNNTGYYLNPAETSYVNALNIGPVANGASYLNINGYNAYGGTGYHGFLTVYNSYGGTNPQKFFRLSSSGSFEIVNNAYNAVIFTFADNGDFTAAGNITAYSDRKIKDNFEPIANALSKVLQLNGMTFTRIDKEDTTKRYGGLVAQDVKAVLPEAVDINETMSYGEVMSVDYNATIALLVEAIKEQQTHINKLEDKINSIQNNRG